MAGHHEPSGFGQGLREARAGLPLLGVLPLHQGGRYNECGRDAPGGTKRSVQTMLTHTTLSVDDLPTPGVLGPKITGTAKPRETFTV